MRLVAVAAATAAAVTWRLVPGSGPAGGPAGLEISGRVARVVDGDTIVVAGVGTVRYLGIDTPELHHPRHPVQRFARRARRANAALVAGRVVRLLTDVERRDAYGRLLAYVYVDGQMVNARLVADGMARAFPFAPNLRFAGRFAALQAHARARRRGLWGAAEGGPPWGAP